MKKSLIVIIVIVLVLLVCGGIILYRNSDMDKPPMLEFHVTNSNEIKTAKRGGYRWTKNTFLFGKETILADSAHPIEFEYDEDSTISISEEEKIIIDNKDMTIKDVNIYYPDSYEALERNVNFDSNSISGIDKNDYILEIIMEHQQGVIDYGIKISSN